MACRMSPVRGRLAPSSEGRPPRGGLRRSRALVTRRPTGETRAKPLGGTPPMNVVVIGAGPAGLSTALALKDAGHPALVLEQAEAVAASWRGRYDRLRLNSPKGMSHLAGRRFEK